MCLATPGLFGAIGAFYDDLGRPSEGEVGALRRQARTAESESRRLKARLGETEAALEAARRAAREGRSQEELAAAVRSAAEETDRLARAFSERALPVLAFLDTHVPGKAEPPYPPHCEAGTGEEDLVPALEWLAADDNTTLVRKDCINGFIGATLPDGRNRVVDWVNEHAIEQMLIVGICTDICVMDFVLTALSARNHGMMPTLTDILVYEPGCATFDLPKAVAEDLGYGGTAAHPQDVTHYMGLYFMASRGARLVSEVALG